MLRGGTTYAIGRGVRSVTDRKSSVLDRPGVKQAEVIVNRFGPFAVTFGFATVGVQTAINVAAGSLRMSLWRFIPALVTGALLWATIYVTVGLAVLATIWQGSFKWVALGVAAIAVVVIATRVTRKRLLRIQEEKAVAKDADPCPGSDASRPDQATNHSSA